MTLIEETPIPGAALPIAAFRAHLRLGSGFGEDDLQDDVLEACLRAAMSQVEAQTAKALITRQFSLRIASWTRMDRQTLPLRPVVAPIAVEMEDAKGERVVLDPSLIRIMPDYGFSFVAPERGMCLPSIPVRGLVILTFDAGHGPDWGDVPADLARAAMDLAASHYEGRGGMGADATVSRTVEAILAKHRPMRLGMR